MANSLLQQYGIKEVADVTFYKIDANGNHTYPVLYLDTLKVSTIEQTGETADARGGKGNPKLITWDYGKEITVTLEDALFSAKSMAIMFGDDDGLSNISGIEKTITIKATKTDSASNATVKEIIVDGKDGKRKITLSATDSSSLGDLSKFTFTTPEGSGTVLDSTIATVSELTSAINAKVSAANDGDKFFLTYTQDVSGRKIEISANKFPGTYYVTGDTYARSNTSGDDEFFQFIIHKAKITSENTITLEAEGDPSTFSMNLTVLRPESGPMMELVQYTL